MRGRVPRHMRQVCGAINRCRVADKKSNSRVWADGPRRTVLTPTGPRSYETPVQSYTLLTPIGPRYYFYGTLTFEYYDTIVLMVDLDNQRLTDYGYFDYSISTQRNIKGWLDAVKDRFRLDGKIAGRWYEWTNVGRKPLDTDRRKTRPVDPLMERFRAKVPWVTYDSSLHPHGPRWWFNWAKYDEALAEEFWASKQFLAEDQNHRYFDYDWSDSIDLAMNKTRPNIPSGPIKWIRHFKDEDAMRRWRQREKRNGRPCPPI